MALFDFIRRSSKMYFFKKVVIKFLRGREKLSKFPFFPMSGFCCPAGKRGFESF